MIVNNIQYFLEKNDKSIYWLSKEAEIVYPNLLNIVNKPHANIQLKTLDKIITALNCDLTDIISYVDSKEYYNDFLCHYSFTASNTGNLTREFALAGVVFDEIHPYSNGRSINLNSGRFINDPNICVSINARIAITEGKWVFKIVDLDILKKSDILDMDAPTEINGIPIVLMGLTNYLMQIGFDQLEIVKICCEVPYDNILVDELMAKQNFILLQTLGNSSESWVKDIPATEKTKRLL